MFRKPEVRGGLLTLPGRWDRWPGSENRANLPTTIPPLRVGTGNVAQSLLRTGDLSAQALKKPRLLGHPCC